MPLPTPTQGETENKFHSRCMANSTMKREYPEQKQRNAICYSQWDRSKTKSRSNNTMHIYPNLASRVFNTPLFITQNKLDEILSFLGDRLWLDYKQAEAALSTHKVELSDNRTYFKIKNTAIVPITGTLVYKGGWLDALSGISSYEGIRTSINDALTAVDIENIVLDVDTHGGEGSGLFDVVDYIYSIRNIKPIIGIANERALSAGYAILSAASEVYGSRTSVTGSIGAVILHKDISKALDKAGVKVTAIYSGSHKVDMASFKPLEESVRLKLQEEVDKARDLFVKTVARNNDTTEEAVYKTEAAVFVGKEALDNDLMTGIKTYNEILEYVDTTYGRKRTRGGVRMFGNFLKGGKSNMARAGQVETNEKTYTEEEVTAVMNAFQEEMKASINTEVEKQVTSKLTEQLGAHLEQERERVFNILQACTNAGLPELASDHILKGSSIDMVNQALITTLAVKSNAQVLVTANNPSLNGSVGNPLIEDAKRRAKEYFK